MAKVVQVEQEVQPVLQVTQADKVALVVKAVQAITDKPALVELAVTEALQET
jgi:hypothetical protein